MSTSRRVASLLAVAFALGSCDDARDTSVAGGSSTETSNTLAARYVDDQGRPVSGAAVRIRPADWGSGSAVDSIAPGGRTRLDTALGEDGSLLARGFRPGLYSVEVVLGSLTLRRELRTGAAVVVDTLLRPGGVAGRVSPRWKGVARIVGTDIVVAVDDSGRFSRTGLAAGAVVLDLDVDSAGIRRKARIRTVVPPRATADLGDVAVLVQQEENPALWSRRERRTIDNTATGITRDVEDFPLWIPLPDSVTSRDDVSDLRVRDEDDSARPIELVPASASRSGGLWARMRRIDGSSSEHHLDAYWGNDEAPSWSDPASVFDSAVGWRAVWHMDRDGSCAVRGCAPLTGAAGFDTGTTGGSRRFDGAQTLAAADSGSLEPSDLSVSVWVFVQSIAGTEARLVWKDSDGQSSLPTWGFLLRRASGALQVGFRMRGGPSDSGVFAAMPTGRWVQIAATVDRARGKAELLVDGVSAGTFPVDASAPDARRGDLRIGEGFVGLLDELRVERVARASAWFALQRVNAGKTSLLLHP